MSNFNVVTDLVPAVRKLDTSCGVLRSISYATINELYPESEWMRIYTDGSRMGQRINAGAGVFCDMWPLKDAQWKWKPRKHSAASFSAYCKQLCQQSLITGFPTIASTKGLARRALKMLVFVVCTGGFLYQTSEFLRIYWAYPTMVDIRIESPDAVPLPALSFCNANRVRRTAVCLANPDDCAWFTNKSEFCITYPKSCVAWDFDNEMVLGVVMFAALARKNYSREYTRSLGQVYDQLIDGCVVRSVTNSPCKNHLSVMLEDNSGYPHNCFAVESLWGQPDAIQPVLPVTGSVSMLLSLHPEEYFNYYDLVMAHVLMHEAHSVGNPIREGIALVAGKTYDIFVNQVVQTLTCSSELQCTLFKTLPIYLAIVENNCYIVFHLKNCDPTTVTAPEIQKGGLMANWLVLWPLVPQDPGSNPGGGMDVCEWFRIALARVTERLPAPYNTNCTDYLALWRKNGGYGPLTGKSCAEQCKMQSMVESTGCVAQTISYPNNYTVCTDPSIYPADNVIEQCSRQCSDACRMRLCYDWYLNMMSSAIAGILIGWDFFCYDWYLDRMDSAKVSNLDRMGVSR
ncbi:uncharacterized protein CEXT_78181 [Caerostris extrusa]|uniref:Uncharacterized protein n=1 Tax=Caerostris extrusa TaxID=172846 RepID=A0AAV4S274_CAEEX|nr:uncharacterized protein CEXT_78181 [Caerostris extrusa]